MLDCVFLPTTVPADFLGLFATTLAVPLTTFVYFVFFTCIFLVYPRGPWLDCGNELLRDQQQDNQNPQELARVVTSFFVHRASAAPRFEIVVECQPPQRK